MKEFIKGLPYPILIIMSIFMAFAPFQPEPHLVEKVRMLSQGLLSKPLDMFDLLWHLLPSSLLLAKFIITKKDEA